MTTAIDGKRTPLASPPAETRRSGRARRFVGGLYLVTGGINAGMVAADPQAYRTFADGSFWTFVTTTWHDVVMAHPYVWFLLLAGGEIALGLLLLRGGRPARWGWAGVITFHVLLMSFGFGFWLWSLPALAFLVPAARADWASLAGSRVPATEVPAPVAPRRARPSAGTTVRRPVAMLWRTLVLAALVVASSLYGLLAETPYRSLAEATVLGARAQDACSILVAALLVALAARSSLTTPARLLRLGLLGYLTYSYLIYVSGVPMNRVFLAYVAIVALSAAGLLAGLREVLDRPPVSRPTRRLRLGTGWMLVVTAVLFAGLWLSTLLPYALGGAAPDPEGVGGTPYPVFWLDLALVLPAIAAVGLLLLRDHPAGPPLATVALIKIVTLFAALWTGPVVALLTYDEITLGPDAGPSLVLLAVSTWLVVRWLRTFPPGGHPGRPARLEDVCNFCSLQGRIPPMTENGAGSELGHERAAVPGEG